MAPPALGTPAPRAMRLGSHRSFPCSSLNAARKLLLGGATPSPAPLSPRAVHLRAEGVALDALPTARGPEANPDAAAPIRQMGAAIRPTSPLRAFPEADTPLSPPSPIILPHARGRSSRPCTHAPHPPGRSDSLSEVLTCPTRRCPPRAERGARRPRQPRAVTTAAFARSFRSYVRLANHSQALSRMSWLAVVHFAS